MRTHRDIASLRAALDDSPRVALVPTMGHLHRGHLKLIERAHRVADSVVASIFVNPMQFSAGEDFERYPRSPEQDSQALADAGVDHLFLPDAAAMYPQGLDAHTRVVVPKLSEILCGANRPGHFDGVATIVTKLLLMVAPEVAVFGEKDYQQLLIIRRLVEDLNIATRIEAVATERETDGLALSSRNAYLDPEQRAVAPRLHRALEDTRKRIEDGEQDCQMLVAEAEKRLSEAGFSLDYYTIRRGRDLSRFDAGQRLEGNIIVLAAATIGYTRLIDNVTFQV